MGAPLERKDARKRTKSGGVHLAAQNANATQTEPKMNPNVLLTELAADRSKEKESARMLLSFVLCQNGNRRRIINLPEVRHKTSSDH